MRDPFTMCTCISNHHVVLFKCLTIVFVNYTSIKLENKVDVFSVVHEGLESKKGEFTSQSYSPECGDSWQILCFPNENGESTDFSLHDYYKENMRSDLNCLTYHWCSANILSAFSFPNTLAIHRLWTLNPAQRNS